MRSMTGYGKGVASDDRYDVSAELKSVNHRFLDIGCRLPKQLAFLEDTVRVTLRDHLHRGHVEAALTVRRNGASDTVVRIDEPLVKAYLKAAASLSGIPGADVEVGKQISVADLLSLEGVMTVEDASYDEDAVRLLAQQALSAACDRLNAMRETEGERLRDDLTVHLDAVAALREKILLRAPAVPEEYRKRLMERIQSLAPECDPVRIAQEVAIFADRCAIDEELARLESHIGQYRITLAAEGETGKKLDFLTQEMNREANTIGSKANDAGIAHLVVELKGEIEKLREQVQNVE